MSYTATQKLEVIRREIKYRIHVYPRLVAEGRMTQQAADFQLDIMRDIAADYETKAEAERLL